MVDLKRVSLIAGLVGVIALPTTALGSLVELHPNLAPGLNGGYTFPDTNDSVNLFNGSLHLIVPLGQVYPVAENFRYQLVLQYNSNVWKRTQVSSSVVRADPTPFSNAGLGWDLSFGRLLPPQSPANASTRWVYVAQDGSLHAFYLWLHAGVPDNDPGEVAEYTRNGTYMRLKTISSTERRVEFPDGTWKAFRLSGSEWRLEEYRNSSGKGISVHYFADRWEVRDDHGRVQKVFLRSDTTGTYGQVVDRVELTAFGGATAVFDLSYTDQTLARDTVDNDPATGTAQVPFLDSIHLADGTSYRFSLNTATTNGHYRGRIATVELPTLGKIEYDYAWTSFYQTNCPTELPTALQYASGVQKRRTRDVSGALEGEWLLSRAVSPMYGGTACAGPLHALRDVWKPSGDLDRFWFNATSSSQAWERRTYGYPLSYNWQEGGGRKLSSQVFDCDAINTSCVHKRNLWVSFEADAEVDPLDTERIVQNRREVSRLQVFIDDPLPTGGHANIETNRSRFDGLGHYRVVETRDNWGSAPAEVRTTEYSAAAGDFPSAGWTMPAPTAPWVLEVSTSETLATSDGSQKLATDHCYQSATGLLIGTRTRSAANARSASDLLRLHAYDGWGNRVKTSYFGGDVQAIPTGSACPSVAGTQYAVSRSFAYGSLARSTFLDAAGTPVSTHEVDRDIDPHTGLTAAERDTAGLETSFDYDASGQIALISPQPGHGTRLLTSRFGPSGTLGGSVRIDRIGSSGGAPFSSEEFDLDNFGRKVRHWRAMPGSTGTERRWEHDALGHVTQFFDWGSPNPTTYLTRDAFGRELHVRPPDGTDHDVTYVYRGNRERDVHGSAWFYRQATSVDEAPFRFTETFDRRNLLVRHIDHPMANWPSLSTKTVERSYDIAGNHLSSKLDGQPVGGINTYDRRGFLTRVSASGGGATHYGGFDAFGNATQVERGYGLLVHTFDRQSRLVRVADTAGFTWKEFIYAGANSGGNLQAGKLIRQDRWTTDGLASHRVTEAFVYGGVGGRVSRKDLEVLRHNSYRAGLFRTEITYDEAGNTKRITYPQCSTCASAAQSSTAGALVVENVLDADRIAQVRTIDTRLGTKDVFLSYHPSGLLSTARFPNGWSESWTADPTGLPRLSRLTVTDNQGKLRLDHRDYEYDGTGRLTSMRDALKATYQFLVPLNRTTYSSPSQPPTQYAHPCEDEPGFIDPFGVQYKFGWDENCHSTGNVYVNTNDQPVLTENYVRTGTEVVANEAVWTLRAPSGALLTEYATDRSNPSVWRWTKDYVYRDGTSILKTIERKPRVAIATNIHLGQGGPGVTSMGEAASW